jgi:F-type H+-transporting ATPase subunit delta
MQLTPRQYARAWYEALKEAKQTKWEEISQNILRRLQREGKLNQLSSIVDAMKEIESTETNKAYVEVTSAYKASVKELELLAKELTGAKDVEVAVKEDESLLGGVVVRTKNDLWDISLKHQLEQLKEQLNK